MEKRPQFKDYNQVEESINVKELTHKLLVNWHWFMIFALLGLATTYVVNKTLQPNYLIKSTLYAPTQNEGLGLSNIFETAGFRTQSNIQNHIGILNSYSLIRQTLENLDWKVLWYVDDVFSKVDLYKYSPFKIEHFNPLLNVPGVKINITPVDNDRCILSANEKLKVNRIERIIKFEQEYNYGDTLQYDFFNFILNKPPFTDY